MIIFILVIYMLLAGVSIYSVFVVSLSLILYYFYKSTETFLCFIYSFHIFLIIIFPVVASTLSIGLEYSSYQSYSVHTLIYVFWFIVVTIASYKIATKKTILKTSSLAIFRRYFKATSKSIFSIKLTLVCIYIVSLCAKYYLFDKGYYRFLDDPQPSNVIEYVKMLAMLDIFVLLAAGYYVKTDLKKYFISMYVVLIALVPIFGVLSGSRFQTILVLIVIFYNHFYHFKKHCWKYLPTLLLVPFVFMIFPILGIYRGGYSQSLLAISKSVVNDESVLETFIATLVDRMNYLGVIDKVVNTFSGDSNLRWDYLDNLTGLIPRAIWHEKPIIGIDLNSLGIELGILRPGNTNTSIGLSIIGESYYELREYGIFVAVVQGMMFGLVDKYIRREYVSEYIIYFFIVLSLVARDSYLYILPSIILLLLLYLPFSYLINNKMK